MDWRPQTNPHDATAQGVDRVKFKVPDNLGKAKFVFVGRELKKSPLQNLYNGPYEVLKRYSNFTIQIGSRQ